MYSKNNHQGESQSKQVKNQFEVDFVESIKTLSDNTRGPTVLLETEEFIWMILQQLPMSAGNICFTFMSGLLTRNKKDVGNNEKQN